MTRCQFLDCSLHAINLIIAMNWCDLSISLLFAILARQSATKLLVAPRLALLLGKYIPCFLHVSHLPSMNINQLTLLLVTTVGVMIHLPRRSLTSSRRRQRRPRLKRMYKRTETQNMLQVQSRRAHCKLVCRSFEFDLNLTLPSLVKRLPGARGHLVWC